MARRKSRGIGDSIEKFTEATGIKSVVDKVSEITGLDCGCDKRKETLNQLFPYKKPECFNENELEILSAYKERKPVTISPVEQNAINKIYARVMKTKVEYTTCGSCLADRLHQLMRLYNEY